MNKLITRWYIWKFVHDFRKKIRRNFWTGIMMAILIIIFSSPIVYLGTENYFLRHKQNEFDNLQRKITIIEYQLNLCQGNIIDGPEYHRGFLK